MNRTIKPIAIGILLFLFLLLSGCASLPKRYEWTPSDKALYVAACGANAYDFYTTKKYLDRHPENYIQDPWPSLLYLGEERPDAPFFAMSKAAQLGIAYLVFDRMPSKWRGLVLFFLTGTWAWCGMKTKYLKGE